jgi:gamma-glutamyltranspeptidase/glutathione hydrolase
MTQFAIGSGSIRQAITRRRGTGRHVLLALLLAVVGCARAEPPVVAGRAEAGLRVLRPATVVTSDSAMVVSASPYATEAGLAVLRNGGNAVDAAVAVAFTLAVTYPTAGNIGGGGFLVARINGKNVALDFREKAPGGASRDMYLDSAGQVTDRSLTGALAAGVPG